MKYSTRLMIYIVLFWTIFVLYIWQHNLRYYDFLEGHFDTATLRECSESCKSERNIVISAVITQRPTKVDYGFVYYLRGMRVISREEPNFTVGDTVGVSGTLHMRVTEGKNTLFSLIEPEIISISFGSEFPLWDYRKWLYLLNKLSESLLGRIETHYTSTHGGLVAGMLFGVKAAMPDAFYDALIKTGTVHIIAASGYNIAIFSGLLLTLLMRLFNRKISTLLASFGIIIYVFISGASEPVIRAGIMGLFALTAVYFGREYLALWGLALTVAIMLAVNPQLVSSVSFHLSVSATWGMVALAPALATIIKDKPKGQSSSSFSFYFTHTLLSTIKTDFVTTFAAVLATLPVVLITFGSMSWISVPVNVLVLWTIPPIMLFGSLTVLFSYISSQIASFIALLTQPFLFYFIEVIEYFARFVPNNSTIIGLDWWFGFGYYVVLISLWSILGKKVDR